MKVLHSAGRARFLMMILIALTVSSLSFAQTYTVTDLGDSLGGNSSGARAVNASAQITGYALASGNNVSDVFLYSNAAMKSLGTLGGTTGIGNGINISGQVAGYSTDSGGNYRAFISSSGHLINIGDLGGNAAVAYGINDLGQVVGTAVTSNGAPAGFLAFNESSE